MATGDRKDPYRGYNFKLEMDGIVRAGFHECTGLEEEKGSVAGAELLGLNKYGNITLKRGSTDDRTLWNWHKGTATANAQRKNGSVILADESGQTKARWNFHNAFPVKIEGPSLDVSNGETAIQTLELAHEGLTKA